MGSESMSEPVEDYRDEELEQHMGSKKLQLSRKLTIFPTPILKLAASLAHLDLSNNALLSTLPNSISELTSLKIAFFSNCSFKTFPAALSRCPSLEMVAFKSNGMTTIPEDALPPKLRWLILTQNNIDKLPDSIGSCTNLTKCMLAGNDLIDLPSSMQDCRNLTLLRLARNNITTLPPWLVKMPSLSFLGLAGNPCCDSSSTAKIQSPLPSVPWNSLEVGALLGEGASGIISQAEWRAHPADDPSHVAVKIFKGTLTSDGSPADELAATIAAGKHPNLVSPLGLITSAPSPCGGLVMELIPAHYDNLGGPPTLLSCVRDSFPEGTNLSIRVIVQILKGIAAASLHLHARAIMHGDLYAHNILNDSFGHALLGDFGAASVYANMGRSTAKALEQLEMRAFGYLIEDLLGLVTFDAAMIGEKEWSTVQELGELKERCIVSFVAARPLFAEVCEFLSAL